MKSIQMNYRETMTQLAFEYRTEEIGQSRVIHADCFEWLSRIPENSIHAIVTDPPYGVKEYEFDQIEKRSNGNGAFGGFHPHLMVVCALPCRDSPLSTRRNVTP
ncbi:MAG: hypothetical protein NVS3B14_06970 [Ktedonobacteraceae bacterium]